MTLEESLLKMFDIVHGIPTSGSCYVEIARDCSRHPSGVNLCKDGNVCWTATKEDLLFDYITRGWK